MNGKFKKVTTLTEDLELSHTFTIVGQACGMKYDEVVDELDEGGLIETYMSNGRKFVSDIDHTVGFMAIYYNPFEKTSECYPRMWDKPAHKFVEQINARQVWFKDLLKANEANRRRLIKQARIDKNPWPETHEINGRSVRSFRNDDGVRLTVARDVVLAMDQNYRRRVAYIVRDHCFEAVKIDPKTVQYLPKIRRTFLAINDADVINLTGVMIGRGENGEPTHDTVIELHSAMGLNRW